MSDPLLAPWSVWTAPGIRVHRHQIDTYVTLDGRLYTPQDVDSLRFHLADLSGLHVYATAHAGRRLIEGEQP